MDAFLANLDEADRMERRVLGDAVEDIQRNRRQFLFMGMDPITGNSISTNISQYTDARSRKIWDDRVYGQELATRVKRAARHAIPADPSAFLQGSSLREEFPCDEINNINISLVDSESGSDDLDGTGGSGLYFDTSESEDEDPYNIGSMRMPRGLQDNLLDDDFEELQHAYDPLDFLEPLRGTGAIEVETTTSKTITTRPVDELIDFATEETAGEELYRLVKAYDLKF